MYQPRHFRTGIMTAAWMVILLFQPGAFAQSWVLNDTMTMETINGVSTGTDGFSVMVGNAGSIVHRDDQGNFMPVMSGTTQDLFDVYVVDQGFAVAVGMGIGLIWDGSSWQTFFTDSNNLVYTSIWASPEKDVVVYNFIDPGSPLVFHTAYYPPSDTFLSGAFVSGFDIGYCGQSEDIKSITQDGSVRAYNNTLLPAHPDVQGTSSTVLFDNSAQAAFLTAVWLPPAACADGPLLPADAFAIDNGRTFMRFSPISGWTAMPVNGGVIPSDHNLIWLGGAGPNYVIAVGIQPIAGGGNQGVIWIWDGVSWKQDAALPDLTPGLTDIAVRYRFEDSIFSGDFEGSTRSGPSSPTRSAGNRLDILAAAENGQILTNEQNDILFATGDLAVTVLVREQPPYMANQVITFDVSIINSGPATSYNLGITGDRVNHTLDSCRSDDVRNSSVGTIIYSDNKDIGQDETIVCQLQVIILEGPFPFFRTTVNVTDLNRTERTLENNQDVTNSDNP